MLGESHDVIELLSQDHQHIRRLLEQLDRETDPAQLCVLYVRIVHEMTAHEAAEQQVVFPAFRTVAPAEEQEARHWIDEHGEINQLMAEMRMLSPDDPGFEKRAAALCIELQAHFAVEEERLFPRLNRCASREDRVELGEQVLAVKQAAPLFPELERLRQ